MVFMCFSSCLSLHSTRYALPSKPRRAQTAMVPAPLGWDASEEKELPPLGSRLHTLKTKGTGPQRGF